MHRSSRLKGLTILALSLVTISCLDASTGIPDEVPIEETVFASSLGVNLAASTRTTHGAYYRDLTVGTGALVADGQTLGVRYTGWLSNGQQFESNATTGAPIVFVLGDGDVIAGWEETIPGMRVGGRRQLIIPPALAYGPLGSGPIPGNAVIVFNVEIISAQ